MIIILIAFSVSSGQAKEFGEILQHIGIYTSRADYCAWPAMIRAANGDILVFFSLNEEHLGPNGKIVLMRSQDSGATWEGPETVFDTIIDDRDVGITLLHDGSIVSHFWSTHWTREEYQNLPALAYEPKLIERWIAHVEQPEYHNAYHLEGAWCCVSRDHGKTWTRPLPGKDSIHGGIQLAQGPALVAAYRLEAGNIGVYRFQTKDSTWKHLATIPSPEPDSIRFAEPHLVQMASGRIIMMIRVSVIPYNDLDPRCVLWLTYSDDQGQSWALPAPTPLSGLPPHLLRLADGRVLCSYGYRKAPFGQRACLSPDGVTWSLDNEIILRNDAVNGDLGYPVSLELAPGKILTVYYQPDPKDGLQQLSPPDPHRSRPDIWGTIWKLN